MAYPILLYLIWPLAFGGVCYLIWGELRTFIAFQLKKRETGCHRAPQYPHAPFSFGYDIYRQRKDALKEGRMQALYSRDFDRIGKTFEERVLAEHVISTMDKVNHQYIHTSGFEEFTKQTGRTKLSAPVFGNGIWFAEGAHWKHSRGLVRPIFARAELGNLSMVVKHINRFMLLLPKDGQAFDLQPMLKRLCIDISTQFVLGKSVESQTPQGGPSAEALLKAWDEAVLGMNKRRQSGIFALRYAFDKSWPQALRVVHDFFDAHVARALELTKDEITFHRQESEKSVSNYVDPTRDYILLYEMAKEVRDPIRLRFEMMNIFLPSRDATGALVGNIFFQLARHSIWWTKLREEALKLDIDVTDPEALSFELLKDLLPFRYVIFETLRTIGPAGRVYRKALVDTTLPQGGGPDGKSPIFVPAGVTICTSTFHVHHDRDIWGPDVNEFKPERWSNRKGIWEFVAFLGGPRMCPAQQQVITQVTYLLLRVVLEFESITNMDPVHEYIELQRMAIESRNGVKIALHPAR